MGFDAVDLPAMAPERDRGKFTICDIEMICSHMICSISLSSLCNAIIGSFIGTESECRQVVTC